MGQRPPSVTITRSIFIASCGAVLLVPLVSTALRFDEALVYRSPLAAARPSWLTMPR